MQSGDQTMGWVQISGAHGWAGQGSGGAGDWHTYSIAEEGTHGLGLSWNGAPGPMGRGWKEAQGKAPVRPIRAFKQGPENFH